MYYGLIENSCSIFSVEFLKLEEEERCDDETKCSYLMFMRQMEKVHFLVPKLFWECLLSSSSKCLSNLSAGMLLLQIVAGAALHRLRLNSFVWRRHDMLYDFYSFRIRSFELGSNFR